MVNVGTYIISDHPYLMDFYNYHHDTSEIDRGLKI